jgi:diguanylate cyclase
LKRPAELAVRYGGEEFTILLPETNVSGAGQLAEEILQAIRDLNIEHPDHPLGIVTASAGVTSGTPTKDATTPAGMIKSADAFLYAAKNSGRNQWASELASLNVSPVSHV